MPTLRRWIDAAATLLITAAVGWLVIRYAKSVPYADVRSAWQQISSQQIALAAFLAAVSYLLQTLYDRVALRELGRAECV